MEQQRPSPSEPSSGSRRWFQSCIVSPMILWPSRASRPATVELSTPPLIATAMGLSGMGWSQWRDFAQMSDRVYYRFDEGVDLFNRIGSAEGEANAGAGPLGAQSDSEHHVRRLDRSARARRSARDRESAQIERNHHGLAFQIIEIQIRRVGNARRAATVDTS